FASGGWGWNYAGYPDSGPMENQPGGWTYALLPFIEQDNVYKMGSGMAPGPAQDAVITQRLAIVIKTYNCPSRRVGGPFPNSIDQFSSVLNSAGTLMPRPPQSARGDYAACTGSDNRDEINQGTPTSPLADQSRNFNGITYYRSKTRPTDVTRGLSNTYL